MLTYVKTISEDLLAHMQKDNDIIIASFQDYMKPDKVATRILVFAACRIASVLLFWLFHLLKYFNLLMMSTQPTASMKFSWQQA